MFIIAMVLCWYNLCLTESMVTQCLENIMPSIMHENITEITTWYVDENDEKTTLFYRNYGDNLDEIDSMSLLACALSRDVPCLFVRVWSCCLIYRYFVVNAVVLSFSKKFDKDLNNSMEHDPICHSS